MYSPPGTAKKRADEVTKVDEMLQGMKRYRGIFICTTSLLGRLNQAALRRFTFKIKFSRLTVAQREQMFIAEALVGGDAAGLRYGLRARLAKTHAAVPRRLCGGEKAN